MSKYSGKCDCFDFFDGYDDYYISKSNFFINNKKIPINNRKDLTPYYPYVISSGAFDKDKGATVYLTSESWVDIEEKRLLTTYLEIAKKEYRKAKRKKIAFNKEEAKKYMSIFPDKNYIEEIIARVEEKGEKADIAGIKIKGIYDYYRQELINEMKRVGYSEEYAKKFVYHN